MGGKGRVGKTSVMAGLAEWFDANQIPVVTIPMNRSGFQRRPANDRQTNLMFCDIR
jgi:thymidylate kinase